jgi:glyoxylase-like metal-dependent hydrolase (beta-lactamase superfamily II)
MLRKLLAVACLCAASAVAAAQPQSIAPHTVLLRGGFEAGRQPDGNSVILLAPDGLIVVDSGRHPGHAQAIVDFANRRDQPVVAIINTHWHLDHIGGNPRLRSAFPGVQVHASDALAGAMQGFLARYREQLEQLLREAGDDVGKRAPFEAELAILDAGPALAPDHVVSVAGERSVAGLSLRIGLAKRAATEGDVWLYDPATRVLVAGDLVTLPAPFFDTACGSGWVSALAALEDVPFETLVPGHGTPMGRAAFGRYRAAFVQLLDCAASDVEPKACADGWLAGVGELVPASEQPLARMLLDYYLDQVLRGDQPAVQKACEA